VGLFEFSWVTDRGSYSAEPGSASRRYILIVRTTLGVKSARDGGEGGR
jgi:hypothetical protein